MMTLLWATKMLSADLKNVGQGHRLHKSIYLSYYTAHSNQIFPNRMLLGLATLSQLTLKMQVKVTILLHDDMCSLYGIAQRAIIHR